MVKMRAALLLLLAASAAQAQPSRQPSASLHGDRVQVVLPATVLKDSRVRARLESALTTTFILKTRLGAARLEIRYDLWDEVYHVKRIHPPNRVTQQKINATQLEEWWRTPIDIGALAGDTRKIDVELTVVPFSAAEESDAREWLSKSGGAGGPSPDSKSVVDVLIGTTLSAKPIVSYRWTVEIRRQ